MRQFKRAVGVIWLATLPASADVYEVLGPYDTTNASWGSVVTWCWDRALRNAASRRASADVGLVASALEEMHDLVPREGRLLLSVEALDRLSLRPEGGAPACPQSRSSYLVGYAQWHGIEGHLLDGQVLRIGASDALEWRQVVKVKAGSVRDAIAEALRPWGFELGRWGTGGAGSLLDYRLPRDHVLAVPEGLEGVLWHFARQYGLEMRVNRLDRTVDVHGGLKDAD